MNPLSEAAQQALEALEEYQSKGAPFLACDGAVAALRAALAQQAEPVAGRAFLERILAAMEGVIDVADRKTDEFDALRSCVIDLTVMLHAAPPQQVAQQAEPLNLRDPAVQKRLATQWGYVPAAAQDEPVAWRCACGANLYLDEYGHPASRAAPRYGKPQQAEPVEPVAWRTFDGEGGYDYRTYADNENYAAEWAQRNPRHVGWVEPLYAAPPQRKQAEPVEPVAWEGWWLHHGQHNYRAKPLTSERVKELMKLAFEVGREAAPPQRKPLPKHDQHCVDVPGYGLMAVRPVRAVERAHGIKE